MVRPPDAADVAAHEVWDDLLRAYAETIELQRSYLLSLGSSDQPEDGAIQIPGFDLPAGLPPMPETFEPWAMSLLSETAGLAELAQQILNDRPAPATMTNTARAPRLASAAGRSTLDQKI
jgi:hypothetical protein